MKIFVMLMLVIAGGVWMLRGTAPIETAETAPIEATTTQYPLHKLAIPPATPPDKESPDEQLVVGIVRHIEPRQGLFILETESGPVVVKATADVLGELHEGDVILAMLTAIEPKVFT